MNLFYIPFFSLLFVFKSGANRSLMLNRIVYTYTQALVMYANGCYHRVLNAHFFLGLIFDRQEQQFITN